jgi:biotin operon repressor
MRHEQALFAQAQQSTACMANHEVDARLCRWLLRARDLSGSDHLPFTQEFLAEMLGVRRTSVTTVARTLQEAGMVKYTRVPRGGLTPAEAPLIHAEMLFRQPGPAQLSAQNGPASPVSQCPLIGGKADIG